MDNLVVVHLSGANNSQPKAWSGFTSPKNIPVGYRAAADATIIVNNPMKICFEMATGRDGGLGWYTRESGVTDSFAGLGIWSTDDPWPTN